MFSSVPSSVLYQRARHERSLGVGARGWNLGLWFGAVPAGLSGFTALSTLSTPPSRRLVGEPLKLFRTDPSSN